MRLVQLDLLRSAGLRRGVKLDLSPGLNVIEGPNGSGKTSLVRAARAMLWNEEPFRGEVRATWEHEGQRYESARETNLPPSWEPASRPALPDARFARCFTLSVDDFLQPNSATDSVVEGEIRKELSSGYDLVAVSAGERKPSSSVGRDQAKAWRASRESRRKLQADRKELAQRERGLTELQAERDAAREAQGDLRAAEDALALAEARRDLREAERELAEFPPGMAKLTGRELDELDTLEADLAKARDEAREELAARGDAQAAIEATHLVGPVPAEVTTSLDRHHGRLLAADQALSAARTDLSRAAQAASAARDGLFALGEEGDAPRQVGRERWRGLESAIRARDVAHERLARAEARRDATPPEPAGSASAGTDGRERLAALATAAVGLALALLLTPWFAALTGAGLAWVVLARRAAATARAGRDAEVAAEALAAEKERAEARAQHDVAEAGVRTACVECGLSEELSTIALAEIAELTRARAAANQELAAAQGEVHERSAERARVLAEAREVVEDFDVARPGDAVELLAVRNELERRGRELESATERLAQAERGAARARASAAERERAVKELYERADVSTRDRAELARRVEQRAIHQECMARRDDARRAVARLEEQLVDHESWLRLDLGEAREQVEGLRRRGEAREGLDEEIAAIQSEVKLARDGDALEAALAAEQEARDVLEELREELFEGAAVELLLESVQAEHRAHAEPDILRRAGEWFARFTGHAYQLEVGEGERPFVVRESEGASKAPGELSSGTLAQLQLALRLAVAHESERGVALPIWLDEALSNSDPVRFAEVARSLGELAKERQVIFLASSADDVQRLEEALAEGELDPPKVHHLEALRVEQHRSKRLDAAPLPEIPAPLAGEEPATYAARLGVPALEPFEGVDAQHLFYALHDDLALLHSILSQRVDTIGKARVLFEAPGPEVLDEAGRARFEARVKVLAAWLQGYRQGRGRRLLAEHLREGPASGSKFLDALVAINEERGGDARALLAEAQKPSAERDARLKRFSGKLVEALKADFEDRGVYSSAEPSTAEELEARALTAAAGALERERLTREDVLQLANALAQWTTLA